MNVAWRGTRRPERSSTGVETSSRMGIVTGDAVGRMPGNGIIDLRRGRIVGPSRRPAVCQGDSGTLGLGDIPSLISAHDRYQSLGAIPLFEKIYCIFLRRQTRGSTVILYCNNASLFSNIISFRRYVTWLSHIANETYYVRKIFVFVHPTDDCLDIHLI